MNVQPKRLGSTSITLTEAKKRLRAAHPLVGQLVGGSFLKVLELGGSLRCAAEDIEAFGEWRVSCYPAVKSPQKYNNCTLKLRASLIPRPCHGKSLKQLLPRALWDEIRTGVL